MLKAAVPEIHVSKSAAAKEFYSGKLGFTCAYVYVDDVDALHAEFMAKGVPHLDPVQDQTWGMREFAVTDPDGNTLRFGQEL